MPITDQIDGNVTTEAQFYAEARVWAAIVRNIAKANARKFDKGKSEQKTYKTGSKAGQVEKKLIDSINFKVHRNILQVPVSVGFKVPIHGIWRHWGVGFGQPRVAGKYVAQNSKIKRDMQDWLDDPIARNVDKLYDIAVRYWGDQVLVKGFGSVHKRY